MHKIANHHRVTELLNNEALARVAFRKNVKYLTTNINYVIKSFTI